MTIPSVAYQTTEAFNTSTNKKTHLSKLRNLFKKGKSSPSFIPKDTTVSSFDPAAKIYTPPTVDRTSHAPPIIASYYYPPNLEDCWPPHMRPNCVSSTTRSQSFAFPMEFKGNEIFVYVKNDRDGNLLEDLIKDKGGFFNKDGSTGGKHWVSFSNFESINIITPKAL